ncbi:MAG: patatin-like phospholipase family protein [Anaerolineae bacterium]
MIAFVLSGGGSRGALQVGALRALLERGIQPDMLVGTSVGGLNAAFVAADPSPDRVETLASLWRTVRRTDIYPDSKLRVAWRLARGHGSLYTNETFYRYIQRQYAGVETFSDLKGARCYIVVTNLDTGAMRVMGDRPADKVVDAIMATTALPPLHPPYPLDDGEYVDGGAVALLPIEVALERGAREIYALHIVDGPMPPIARRTVLHVSGKAIGALVQRQWQTSVALAGSRGVRLHHIQLSPPVPCSVADYSKTDVLIQAGYEQTVAFLATVPPIETWRQQAWRRVSGLMPRKRIQASAADAKA